MGSTVKNVNKGKVYANNLQTSMKNLAAKIVEANTALNKMMKGDGTNAYWQGENAYKWYDDAKRALNKAIDNYGLSYQEFEDYANLVSRAFAKAKGTNNKAVLKMIDGSNYTQGVKKNLDSLRITIIPSTVSKEASNDDQTRAAYNQYIELKNAFTALANHFTKMGNEWTNVMGNTTGKMNEDAKKRKNKTAVRAKELNNTVKRIETNFIGDILFTK